ncbi:MAG: DUF2244 domain-containing protein [Hydrogenophaga sp.]|jgi:uncharacterized membrane protein|nr:DUF2244 domain-containing protein [Hydrogenophaga sp.]
MATVSPEGIHWHLRRNCSVSPGQLGVALGLVGGVSLSVAVFFWFQGAVLVLPFAVLELAALATAFLVHARHAADRECISLVAGRLVVELETAGRTVRREFVPDWVRIESPRERDLVEVCGGGLSVRVGRFVRPDLRGRLALEMRQALRSA